MFGINKGIEFYFYLKTYNLEKKKTLKNVKCKKTGDRSFFYRRNTTDIRLMDAILCKNGEYDEVLPLLKNKKVIFDIGANIGIFARLCSTSQPKAKIVCVEPEDKNYTVLLKNVSDIQNIRAIKGALWNKNIDINLLARETGEWGFCVSEANCTKSEEIVKAFDMVSLMENTGTKKIDILKIDVEGAEKTIFDETAEDWIEKVDVLIIELHDYIIEGCSSIVLNRMKKHGFKYIINGENYIFMKEK